MSAAALLLASCAELDEPREAADEEIAVKEQAVINGTRVSLPGLPDNGIVRVSSPSGGCSGTLLTDRWVLTADHCFCEQERLAPATVSVSVYGTNDSVTDAVRAHFTSAAAEVVRHPSMDVALVRLAQTLPHSFAPRIYTGNGTDLVGKTVRIIGFGNNRVEWNADAGVFEERGGHESENWGDMKVAQLTTSPVLNDLRKCANPAQNYFVKSGVGLLLQTLSTNGARVGGADSGSGLFLLGATPEANQLIGVAHRGGNPTNGYVGIWHIRDWIKQTTNIWQPSQCGTALSNGSQVSKAAIATGPDNKLHVVGVFPDNSIGHWLSSDAKNWSWNGKIPNAFTSDRPAITTEVGTQAGQPRKLGLAFRHPSTGVLQYARWSASGGWASPQGIPSGMKIQAGHALAGHNGVFAFAGLDNRAGMTAFDAPTNTWLAAQWAVPSAPLVDPSRGIGLIHNQAASMSVIGYLTTDKRWVQTQGNWACLPFTGSYFCANDAPYATDWLSASMAHVPGDRMYIETVRTYNGVPRHERRTIHGLASYDWSWSDALNTSLGQAATDFQNEVYVVRASPNLKLTVAPPGNCYGNNF